MKFLIERQVIDPYTQDWVDVVDYKGFEIECIDENTYSVFYCGDDIYFETLEEAKEFIDSEI